MHFRGHTLLRAWQHALLPMRTDERSSFSENPSKSILPDCALFLIVHIKSRNCRNCSVWWLQLCCLVGEVSFGGFRYNGHYIRQRKDLLRPVLIWLYCLRTGKYGQQTVAISFVAGLEMVAPIKSRGVNLPIVLYEISVALQLED